MTGLDRARVDALLGRSLLATHDWSTDDLETLLAVAARFEALDRAGVRLDLLRNELAYAMFFDNSTRTKICLGGCRGASRHAPDHRRRFVIASGTR